jgi:hypothetical protein
MPKHRKFLLDAEDDIFIGNPSKYYKGKYYQTNTIMAHQIFMSEHLKHLQLALASHCVFFMPMHQKFDMRRINIINRS